MVILKYDGVFRKSIQQNIELVKQKNRQPLPEALAVLFQVSSK